MDNSNADSIRYGSNFYRKILLQSLILSFLHSALFTVVSGENESMKGLLLKQDTLLQFSNLLRLWITCLRSWIAWPRWRGSLGRFYPRRNVTWPPASELSPSVGKITIYAPMIYTALCIMFWIRAYPLLGQVGGGWALEFSSFLGPKWHSPIGSMPFHRAQKTLEF